MQRQTYRTVLIRSYLWPQWGRSRVKATGRIEGEGAEEEGRDGKGDGMEDEGEGHVMEEEGDGAKCEGEGEAGCGSGRQGQRGLQRERTPSKTASREARKRRWRRQEGDRGSESESDVGKWSKGTTEIEFF